MSATTAQKNYYFHCTTCDAVFKRTAEEVLFEGDAPILLCPQCQKLTFPISRFLYSALLSRDKCTGPKTPEGKRRAALNGRNPQRNVSPETRERRSANAWKHGCYAKKIRPFAPAKFDRYPECAECEEHYRERCRKKEISWCPTVQKPLIQFLQAYKEGKPELLKNLAGHTQAQIYQVVQMGLKTIFDQGVTITEKRQIGKTILENIKAHPILEKLPELIETIGFSADQQMLTPAKQESRDTFKGFLDDQTGKVQKTTAEFIDELNQMTKKLREEFVQNSAALRLGDDALRQYEAEKALEIEEKAGNESK